MAQYPVTGGSGFLGTLLVAKLLEDGHAVTSIDLLPAVQTHYYQTNRAEIAAREDVSAHRQATKMGVIRVLKALS